MARPFSHSRSTIRASAMRVCLLGSLFILAFACTKRESTLDKLDLLYTTLDATDEVEAHFCTEKPKQVKARLKYIFVIDKSGSNTQNYRMNPDGSIIQPIQIENSLATDPDGSRRYAELLRFIQNSPDNDPNRFYTLINFESSAYARVLDPATRVPRFTNDRAAFEQLIQTEYDQLSDQGSTNYIAALDRVYELINNDISAARSNTKEMVSSAYVIVFVSDGFPILNINMNANPPAITAQQPADILQRVRNIIALQSNTEFVESINLFTGYYYVNGNQDPNARELLRRMAEEAGNAIAYEFGTGKAVDFSLFSVPERLIKYSLAEAVVTNASVIWWNDGKLKADTDMDGLPDELETSLGSDPLVADSDGNGVSDLVEYRTSSNSKPCLNIQSGVCQKTGARPYRTLSPNQGGCSSITPVSTTGGVVVFPDTDRDGLNDCEEMVIGNTAGIANFDSNQDMIVDFLAYRNNIDFRKGDDSSAVDFDLDGLSNFHEIKFGLPPLFPNMQLLDLKAYSYALQLRESVDLQDCYTLKVRNIPTIGPDNMVRLYLIQNSDVFLGKPILRIAEKRFNSTSRSLLIQEPQSEAAGVWK